MATYLSCTSSIPETVDAWAGNAALVIHPASATVRDGHPGDAGKDARAPGSIVFLDSRIAEVDLLRASLPTDCEACVLSAERDALPQVYEALADRSDFVSLGLIAHGRLGALLLGASEPTREGIGDYPAELTAIRCRLARYGEVQIYGCAVGQGEDAV